MPRRARTIVGGYAYHILNRANARLQLFRKPMDFAAFETVLGEACEWVPLRILAYVVMPNHWHFVVWPQAHQSREVSEFFRWLTVTHTQRWHAHHGTSGSGHLYQGRFKSFPIEADDHLATVMRYVERNPARAGLIPRAEHWQWGSLWRRSAGSPADNEVLSAPPFRLGRDWTASVNRPETEAELAALRASVKRGQPFGSEGWQRTTARKMSLEHTFRPRGRPKKGTGII